MKRRAGVALTVLALLGAVSAAQAKVTLTWLQGNVTSDRVKALCTLYEKDHPNIKLNPLVVGWDDVDNKFLAMTAGGVAIDLLSNNSCYGWARYRDKDLFSAMDPYINRDKSELNLSDFSSAVMNAYKYKGKQISFPSSQFLACSVHYNAAMLAEAGLPIPTYDWDSPSWAWEDMVDYAKKLTKRNSSRIVSQYGVDFWNADNLITFAWANGGDYYDPESYKTGRANKIIINSPENLTAFTKVAELSAIDKVRGLAIDGFRAGKLAMWLDAGTIDNHYDKKLYKNDFKWGIAPFPMMRAGQRGAFAWNEVFGIPASSKHKSEAWDFIKWFSTVAGTKGQEWPDIPSRKSNWIKMLDWKPLDSCVLDKTQLAKFVEGGMANARQIPRDIIFGSQEIYTAANVGIGMAFDGKMSVAQGLAKAQADGEIARKKVIRK